MIRSYIQKRKSYQLIKKLFQKYERFLVPGMLVAGFLVDLVTFKSVQLETAVMLLGIYAVIAALSIAYIIFFENAHVVPNGLAGKYLRLAAPLALQFTFGALLSASLIFYLFSSAIALSWPLLLMVTFLMIANEAFRKYYLIPAVQLVVYYFILFSLLLLIFPLIFHEIGTGIFLSAGMVSFLIMYIFIRFLARYVVRIQREKMAILTLLLSVFLIMNGLYYLNIIPPIPLSIRSTGIYHSLERSTEGDYIVHEETISFTDRIVPGQTVHIDPSDTIYFYSSIFAPTDITQTIVHKWYYLNEISNQWQLITSPSFTVRGGRKQGYRGYSFVSEPSAGVWRVVVENENGQILGRERFRIAYTETPVLLEQKILE